MPKLTLSMIVKNEEKYLRECLNSVINFVDEIVIVDTGSTDDTIEISKEFGANIFHFKWIDDFSAARNFSLLKSTGDWILFLDADERILEKSIEEINRIIQSPSKLGVKCIINSINTMRNDTQRMKYIRLFKNCDNITFKGRAHEQIEGSLLENSYEIAESNIQIIHLGYDVSEAKLKEKARRNLNLLLKDYNLNKSSYLAYQIANSYSVLKSETEKIKYYRLALKDSNLNRELRSICYLNIAEFEMRRLNLSLAQKYVDKGLNENVDHSLLNLVATQIYGKLNKYEKAIELCQSALMSNFDMLSNSASFNEQGVTIDSSSIIYQGMLLSMHANNIDAFNGFYNNLDSEEAAIIDKISNNNLLSEKEIELAERFISANNIEFYINILNNYTHTNKLILIKSFYSKLKLNATFISYYCSILISLNQISDAQSILENALECGICTAPIFMYLSSIYIQKSQYGSIYNLLKNIESLIDIDPILNESYFLLKDKIQPLLQKQSPLNHSGVGS